MQNLENIYDKMKNNSQQYENERNILIAEKVCDVLKSKILINQKIIANSKSPDCLSLDEFTEKLKEIISKLEATEKDAPERENLESEYNSFIKNHAGKVILKDWEIEELLNYVKYSIMCFGIAQNKSEYTTDNELVKYALLMLNVYIIESCNEKDSELVKWIDFICSSSEAGFYQNNSELYQIKGCGSKYFTIKDNRKEIFAISETGDVSIDKDIDYDNILLVDNLYVGYINLNSKRVVTILSKKEDYYYPVFFNYKGENEDEDRQIRREQDAQPIMTLTSALKFAGLSRLTEPLYDKLMLIYIVESFNDPYKKGISYRIHSEKFPNEEIPSDELYILKTNPNNYEIVRKSDNQDCTLSCDPIVKLNVVLELVGLNYLKEDSYDGRKIDYILLSIQEDGNVPSIVTTDKKPGVTLMKN